MMVKKPEDVAQAFAEAFNSGNIECVLEFYETNAVMAPERGKLAQGTAALRDALNTFLAVGGKMTMKSRYCIQTGDLALTSLDWTLRASTGDGNKEELHGSSIEVIRRQPDGRWLYVIGHPHGAE
jgi:ketosteroid isomerase-like protein